jgi:hypothetical protein
MKKPREVHTVKRSMISKTPGFVFPNPKTNCDQVNLEDYWGTLVEAQDHVYRELDSRDSLNEFDGYILCPENRKPCRSNCPRGASRFEYDPEGRQYIRFFCGMIHPDHLPPQGLKYQKKKRIGVVVSSLF